MIKIHCCSFVITNPEEKKGPDAAKTESRFSDLLIKIQRL